MRTDIRQIWRQRGNLVYMLVIPLTLMLVLPITCIICLIPVSDAGQLPEQLLALLPEQVAQLPYRAALFVLYTRLLAPMCFLVVAVTCAVALASHGFVRERENGTLETVMLTAVRDRDLFRAKVTGPLMVTLVVLLASFFLFSMAIMVGSLVLAAPYFINLEWLITFFMVAPCLAVGCVVFVAFRAATAVSYGESLQTMGYFILAVVLLYILQFTGLFKIGPLLLLLLNLLLLVGDIVLYRQAFKRFTPERLLTRNFLINYRKAT